MHQLANFGLGFMTCAERSAPVLPRADAFRLPLCLAFVMSFLAFRPKYFDPKRKTLYSISRFHVKGVRVYLLGRHGTLPYLLSLYRGFLRHLNKWHRSTSALFREHNLTLASLGLGNHECLIKRESFHAIAISSSYMHTHVLLDFLKPGP